MRYLWFCYHKFTTEGEGEGGWVMLTTTKILSGYIKFVKPCRMHLINNKNSKAKMRKFSRSTP